MPVDLLDVAVAAVINSEVSFQSVLCIFFLHILYIITTFQDAIIVVNTLEVLGANPTPSLLSVPAALIASSRRVTAVPPQLTPGGIKSALNFLSYFIIIFSIHIYYSFKVFIPTPPVLVNDARVTLGGLVRGIW